VVVAGPLASQFGSDRRLPAATRKALGSGLELAPRHHGGAMPGRRRAPGDASQGQPAAGLRLRRPLRCEPERPLELPSSLQLQLPPDPVPSFLRSRSDTSTRSPNTARAVDVGALAARVRVAAVTENTDATRLGHGAGALPRPSRESDALQAGHKNLPSDGPETAVVSKNPKPQCFRPKGAT